MVKQIYLLLVPLLLYGCTGMDITGFFSSPSAPINTRFEESMSWNAAHPIVNIKIDSEQYEFMICSDLHVDKKSDNWETFVHNLRNDPEIYFGLVAGDLSDCKNAMTTMEEQMRFNAATQKRNDTIMVTTGNHDLYFDDWELYKKLFGTSVYYFTVESTQATDLFISLDSSNGTFGTKQKKWLKDFLEKERNKYRHCIIYSHNNLFNTEGSQLGSGNMPIEETAWITNQLSIHNVDLYIMGHDHYQEVIIFGGVRYIVLDALKDTFSQPSYLVVSVEEKIEHTFVPLK